MAVNFSGSLLATGSIISTSGFTGSLSGTASYALDANLLDGKDSSTFATTGSNIFVGNQTITGSFAVSGSTIQVGNNTLLGNTTLSGSIIISGSVGAKADINLGGVLRLDPATDPGTVNLTASFLFTSASNTTTGFDLYYRQSDNIVKFKWLEGGISTGLLYGGVITYSGSTIFVTKGSGIINNLNASTGSEVAPNFKYVTWNDFTGSATYLTSSQNTFIYIDDTGVVRQQPTYFVSTQYQEAIPLGRVTHANYTTITGAGSNVQTTYDNDAQQNEFIRVFGPVKTSGLTLSGHTGGMGLSIGAGTAYNLGGFYPQSPNHPSQYTTAGFPTASIARAYRSGSVIYLDNNNGAFYTTVDSTNWDDGTGVLNSMSSGDWQIQRVFVNPITGRTVVYYGQTTYSTFINALQYLATDPFEEGEFTAKSLVFVGYLVIKGNTTNLTDTGNNSIIQSGIFRNTQGSSGTSAVVSQTLDSLSDVNAPSPTQHQALIYDSGIWVNGNPASASYATTASFVNGISNGTASFANTASFAVTASYLLGQSPSSSYALTASYVNPLVQDVIVTGRLTVGSGSIGASENTLTLGARDTVNEGGQLGFNAPGGTYTSASMLDLYQNRFRLLKGTNAGSTGEILSANLHSGQIAFTFYQNASSFPGTAVANLAVDSGGNIITISPGTVESASYAATASYVLNAVSASRAATSSIASQANQASTVSISGITTDRDFTFPLILTGSSGPSLGLNADLSPGIFYNPSSNLFRSTNIVATGSLLGTSSFADNAATASYVLNAISSSFALTASFVTLAQTASYVETAQTASFILNAVSSSFALTASFVQTAQTASYVETAQTASFVQTAQTASYVLNAVSTSFAATTSFANNLTVAGTLTAQTINVQTITSSIEFNTGSTRNGTLLTNTHEFTGSIYSTGSNTFIGTQIISGSIGLQRENYIQSEIIGIGTANIIGLDNGYQVVIGSNGVDAIVANNRIKGANGSVGAPSFTFDDSNTGLYRIDEDNLGVTAGGTLQVSINTQSSSFYSPVKALAGFTGSLQGTATTASYALNAVSSSYALSSSIAATASYSNDFTVANTLIIDQTLTDYHVVASSAAGENNMFNRVTGSYSAGFFKYTVTNGANARTGEVMAVWNGGSIQYTDNSTLDIGDTSGVTATAVIVSNSIQFNLTTATSGWVLKSLATFM